MLRTWYIMGNCYVMHFKFSYLLTYLLKILTKQYAGYKSTPPCYLILTPPEFILQETKKIKVAEQQ